MTINLNFSDPILVSQGEIPDSVEIKLLKKYFLRPQYEKPDDYRNLASFDEDGEFFTVREDFPK